LPTAQRNSFFVGCEGGMSLDGYFKTEVREYITMQVLAIDIGTTAVKVRQPGLAGVGVQGAP
jgi:hypothetical protein